ncbi:sensor histidine kinase [Kibdelosporangium persicum]|uniref:Two-component sensor histidine kinase n=1 Tax=Kibdelosporangium persicum TaxID=2698649 RepID=A0ABX2F7I4_9PSEU|nr:sensor histidine kinase [Kibdelosporangium persicum]NRN67314.1 Two-component sensor histidine kinase [Kibdelosporangium persicum]
MTGRVVAASLGALGLVTGVAAAVVTEALDAWGYSGYAAMPLDVEIAIFYAVMGVLVTWQKPGNLVGWALVTIAAWDGVMALATALVGAFDSPDQPIVLFLEAIQHAGWSPPIWAIATLLPLIYPDGRLPSPRWWWAVGLASFGILAYLVGGTLSEGVHGSKYTVHNPAAVPELQGFATFLTDAAVVILVASSVIALLSLAMRWRRATGVQARRLSLLLWVLLYGGAQAVVREFVPMPLVLHHILEVLASALIPGAVAIAVTRDRLYDLDLAVRRAIVAVVVTASLIACYLGLYAVSSFVIPIDSAFEAGIIGAAIFPIALLLTRWVRQVAWGRRVDIVEAVTALGQRMRDRIEVSEVPAAVCEEIVNSLHLRFARLELEINDGVRTLAEVRKCVDDEAEPVTFDLRHRGVVVGRLLVAPPEGRTHLDEMLTQALASLADQVAPVVAALRLDEELLRSREQLVTAREEERLRLSRDLHDDVGPTLAGIRLQLDAVRAKLPDDTPAIELMDRAVSAIHDALGIVRRVAYRLRPPELETLGLVGALRELAVFLSAPTLKVETHLPDDVSALSQTIEVAAYRIVAEALTNVVKHAKATSASVRLSINGEGVVLEIKDDGVGLPADAGSRGMGLKFMAQRAQEIAGQFSCRTTEHGTLVRAVLPLRNRV